MSSVHKVVCMTGGSGYIACWLVKSLIQRGYTVKATIRDPDYLKKRQHFRPLEGAKEKLHLFKADLLAEGSFDSAVDGCRVVFHSSVYAFQNLGGEGSLGFTKENGIDLVVINPGHVIGPLLQPTVNFSTEIIPSLINGAQLPYEYFNFVVVRDVAHVHILALENPSTSGRYCLVGETIHHHDVLKLLRKLYPTLHLPERCEDDRPLASAHTVSREKVEGLGMTFTPLEVSIRDTVESLVEKGYCFPLV